MNAPNSHATIDLTQLVKYIQTDPHISEPQRKTLLERLNDPSTPSTLFLGASGGLLANTISHFLALNKTSQILLSLAGFGVGNILGKVLGVDQSHLVDYNQNTGNYTVNTK